MRWWLFSPVISDNSSNMYHARHLDFRPISGDGHQNLSIFITWTYLDTSCLRPIPPGHPRAPKGTQGATRRHPPRPGLWCRDHAAPFGWSGCLGCGHCHLPGRGPGVPWVLWGSCVSAHVGLAEMGAQFLSHKNHPSNQFFWGAPFKSSQIGERPNDKVCLHH